MWDRDTPAISTGLRGLVGEEVVLKAADMDLHSGSFGGAAANPITILARILGQLHDENGRVTIPGFYDGVAEVPAEIRRMWDGLGFDEAEFLGAVGLSVPAGERGFDRLAEGQALASGTPLPRPEGVFPRFVDDTE